MRKTVYKYLQMDKRRQNAILVLLIVAIVWLAVLTWFVIAQSKALENHEFYLREVLKVL